MNDVQEHLGFDPSTWPEYLTVPEVAAVLRISKMTVYRMIHRGDFGEEGATRAGRSFRIDAKALKAYVGKPVAVTQ
jgi:excisionase family DNA binding protein